MSACERYSGEASIRRHCREDGTLERYEWLRADPLLHISQPLIDGTDDEGRDFLLDMYRLRERCPDMDAWHAVRLER